MFSYFDWNESDYKREINKAKEKGKVTIVLDNERGTYDGEKRLIGWATRDGFRAYPNGDFVVIDL